VPNQIEKKLLTEAYRYRLVPTDEQIEGLARHAGTRRFVYNRALARRKEFYAEHGFGISLAQLDAEIADLKHQPDTRWLRELDSQVPQQALRDLQKAFSAFFERWAAKKRGEYKGRLGFPKFRSKHSPTQSFRIPQRIKVRPDSCGASNVGEVYCPKVGWIRFKNSRDIPEDASIKGATFKRDAVGDWHVTITAVSEVAERPLPPLDPETTAGLDAGFKDFIVSSNGERVAPPKHYRRGQKKLRRAQRVLSRRKKGSNKRRRAKKTVARTHRKVANKRKDFLHKLSTEVMGKHDAICIENLNLKGLAKTKLSGLAKSFADAAHGEFRRQLAYKSERASKRFVKVDRWFPSTKICGGEDGCGSINDALTLSDREWTCPECGLRHDRDLNAASNVKAEGLRILKESIEAEGHPDSLNGRGADVRLPTRERLVSKRQRIPRL